MKTKKLNKNLVNVITLGCSKNVVDSENIITQLQANNIDVLHEDYQAEPNIVIVNTCGFIDLAKEESVNTILEYAELKKKGLIEKLYVTGCLSHRYKQSLEEEIPEVDAYFGTMELPMLLEKFNADYKYELLGQRKITTPQHYAYLKISEGCNRTCSFCAIPLMRGKHISRPIEELVFECKNLAKRGVKEVILIAQELTYYGLDLYKKRSLHTLLESLCQVDGVEWIRLHYAYPSKFPLEVFDVMAQQPKIANYLDLPLQHANNEVLQRMRRQITQKEQRKLIAYARKIVPDIAIRTTFLVGYPGESIEEFTELLEFVQEMKFDRVGVFQYSHEEDTTAFLEADDVPQSEKEKRAQQIMDIQKEISFDKNQSKIGKVCRVLFDRIEGGFFVGRTEHDSPEVDNEVLVGAKNNFVRIGDFSQVLITEADEFDLYGEIHDSN